MPPRIRQTYKPQGPRCWNEMIAERPHNKYGSAILIRVDLKIENVNERVQRIVELITIVMPGIVVHSVYKPPNNPFELPVFGYRVLPHITLYNHTTWKTTDALDTHSKYKLQQTRYTFNNYKKEKLSQFITDTEDDFSDIQPPGNIHTANTIFTYKLLQENMSHKIQHRNNIRAQNAPDPSI